MARTRPPATAASDAWALYRRGLAQSHRGEFVSLQTLAASLDAMQAAGDQPGAVLAAAALLITGSCMQSYRRFGELAAIVSPLRNGSIPYANRDDSLIAHAGMLCGMLLLQPSDPFIDQCARRVMSLLELDADVNAKFAAGRLVVWYADPREQRELARHVYALLQPLYDHPDVTPHRLGRWLIIWIRNTTDSKDPDLHRRAREQAQALADRRREPEVVAWLAGAEIERGLRVRDFPAIERALATVEQVSDPANLTEAGRLSWFRGRLALAKREGDAALFHATRARKIAEELALPPPMFGVRLALEAQARLVVGDFDGARDLFRRTIEMVAVLHAEEMRDMLRMVDAYEASLQRRNDARALLASAFAAPRARQFYDTFDTNPTFGATMCALALEHDVEPEFVRRIVELYGMPPPPEAGPAWPWPLRVETFGRLEMTRAGAPLVVHGKTPKKPLELLKALIAFGARGVDKQRLADALWADAEPAGAQAALDMAISRLRKFLGSSDVVVIEDGKIGLNPAQAWIDTWAFDRDVEALQRALRENADDVAAIGERLLALYRGAFLDNEEPQRWMLAARDRWRNRFLRSLSDAGRHHERAEHWLEAIALYERGIEVDTLAEDLYRRLMRCHLARGQPAEAARVYRRCREMLSVQLGIPPAAETEALFQSIYGR